ncbi:SRPBCC family protein [Streptomyces sp. NPDC059637]|uniref:SRPBCC family protein n=1 Tax=Streptomyces sp. NPDC059637 TaxID=3347752 RepID=UPI0036896443
MSDTNGFMGRIADNPAADRLKQELQDYLRARAQQAVTDLGHKLGEGVSRLAEPGQNSGQGLLGSLAKGGQALAEGKSPARAAMSVGASHVKESVKEKVKGLFGKGKGKGKGGGGKSKSVTIIENIDVGVPVRVAYDQWTQFQEFSTWAKGVVSVDRTDDVSSNWAVKVAKSTRTWKATVTEQVPDERIKWTTDGPKGTVKGVVTFHPLGENLTRVLLVLEYFPQGLFEKTGNIWRAQGRRTRLDLKLYRKFIMMRGEATDGWRGEIREGEVVRDDQEVREAEEAEAREEGEEPEEGQEEPEEERGEEEPEDEYEEGEEESEEGEEEPEDEYEEEEEPEEGEEDRYEDEEEEPEYDEEPEDEYEDEDEEEPEEDEDRPRSRPAARR